MTTAGAPEQAQAQPADTSAPQVHDRLANLLQSVGVTNYEPRVLDMLVDFVYSYSKDVLKDAQVIAQAGGRAAGVVTAHEVELAIRQHNFAQPFSMEMLTDLAAKINEEPLPEAVQQNGIAFPRKDALIVHSAQYRVDMPDASFGVPEFTAVPDDAFAEQMDVDVAVPQ